MWQGVRVSNFKEKAASGKGRLDSYLQMGGEGKAISAASAVAGPSVSAAEPARTEKRKLDTHLQETSGEADAASGSDESAVGVPASRSSGADGGASGSGQGEARARATVVCPVCSHELSDVDNVELNAHVDRCLGKARFQSPLGKGKGGRQEKGGKGKGKGSGQGSKGSKKHKASHPEKGTASIRDFFVAK